jgi:hypothetical protein
MNYRLIQDLVIHDRPERLTQVWVSPTFVRGVDTETKHAQAHRLCADILETNVEVFKQRGTKLFAGSIYVTADGAESYRVVLEAIDNYDMDKGLILAHFVQNNLYNKLSRAVTELPLSTFEDEQTALEYVRPLNRMVAGPYGGTSAHESLWVVCPGPDENRWSVIRIEDAIEAGFLYKWVA